MPEQSLNDDPCVKHCSLCKPSEETETYEGFDSTLDIFDEITDVDVDIEEGPTEDMFICRAALAEVELRRQDSLVLRLGKRVQAMLSDMIDSPQGEGGK